jgi:enoyl-CoA hydratase/carnithine racemase
MTATDEAAQSVIVRTDAGEGILHLELNRPMKRNAFDLGMLRTLNDAILGRPSSARVVVISGGAFFCAGADISVYAHGDQGQLLDLTRAAARMIETVSTTPLPVVVAVEGMALGGGFELVLAADIVVAGHSAQMALPEVALGLIPGWGGTQRLAAQVGTRRANEMIMLQQRITADEARALGLVNEVVPDGKSLDRALTVARELAASSATALAATKELVSCAERALAYDAEQATLMRLFASADGVEGVAAFIEKRPALFRGQLGTED